MNSTLDIGDNSNVIERPLQTRVTSAYNTTEDSDSLDSDIDLLPDIDREKDIFRTKVKIRCTVEFVFYMKLYVFN